MSVFPELHHIPRCLQTLGCKRVQETEACSQSRCNCPKSYLPPLWADIQGSNDIKQSLWKCDLVISGLGVERRALPLWRTIYFGWHQHGLEECFRHKMNMILLQVNISKILKILYRNTILFVGANLWADGTGLLVDGRFEERLSPRSEILGDNPTEVLFPDFWQTS